jgi:hypothetical protein
MTKIVLIDYDHIILDEGKWDAILFSIEGENQWIPRSIIDDIWEDDQQVGVPEWFAWQEGLI